MALEETSSAEVLISIVPHSGSYGDVDLLWGWLLGLTTLGVILWSPWTFHPDFILLNVLFASLVGWLASRHWTFLRRLLTRRVRQVAQVDAAARLDFLARRGDTTRERTGLLIFVSRLERCIAIVPDRGVVERVPAEVVARWREAGHAEGGLSDLLARLPRLLESLKEPLALYLPRGADDVDELENRPHVVQR